MVSFTFKIQNKFNKLLVLDISRVVQRKRAGVITQRLMDRNHPLLDALVCHSIRHNSFYKKKQQDANQDENNW